MTIAFIQSIGGASGDMVLAALLDLGLPLDFLEGELSKLGIGGYELSVTQETRREMRGSKLSVNLKSSDRLSPRVLSNLVTNSALTDGQKQRAASVLDSLWEAECRVHGQSRDSLELEELGTVDTLVDVVGVVAGLDYFGVEQVFASPLVLGAALPPRWPGGYPNPAPATLELAAMAQAPVAPEHPMYVGAGELTTPTGAALITSLAEFGRPEFRVTSVGIGLGARDPENFPNMLRIWLGETQIAAGQGRQSGVVLLETNLDDVPGEVLGFAQEQLFAAGALDVWLTPVQMKKNRPGVILSALVPQRLEEEAYRTILRETPTLGVRTRAVERYVAHRESVEIETGLGTVSVKIKSLDGVPVGVAPEYEDCRRLALESGVPYQEVYQGAMAEARRLLLG